MSLAAMPSVSNEAKWTWAYVLTWIAGVFDGQQARSPVIKPTALLLLVVRPAISHRDPNFVVTEVDTVQLEEIHHENTEVLGWIYLAAPDLGMLLQETNRQANDAIAAQPASVHLVHLSLAQEGLRDEHKPTQRRKLVEETSDHVAGLDTIRLINADIHGEPSVASDELDYRDFGLRDDGDFVGYAGPLHRVRQ